MRDDPDFKLGGLTIWVHGYEFPDHNDFWDGSWLNVEVQVEAAGARVQTQGPILRADELDSFLGELELLDRTLVGTASLTCLEPNLAVEVRGSETGQVTAIVKLTPEPVTQSHEFTFELDQTYLKPAIAMGRAILARYPAKGTPSDV
jgi:hypothetical protein